VSVIQDSLSGLAAQLTDSRDRETYAALIAYFRSLPPNDELFHLAQLLGFLSLLGQRLPKALGDFLIELRAERSATSEYYALLQGRLVRLPQEIAAGVDWAALSQTLGESFRQQVTAVGLENTVSLLRSSTQEISTFAGETAVALKLLVQEHKDATKTIATELGKLTAASRQLRDHNAKLIQQERWNSWIWQALLAALLLLAGAACGAAIEKRYNVEVRGGFIPQIETKHTAEREARKPALSKAETKHAE
jgi:hypothetical protein